MDAKKTHTNQYILAVDTSCDDTSAAVVSGQVVLSNVIASQTQLHKQYGGVFPTVAKQAHKENILPTIAAALKRAGVAWDEIAALAVTLGPGLAPALEVGIGAIVELAQEKKLPVIGVNHIEGHVLSALAMPKVKTRSAVAGEKGEKNEGGGEIAKKSPEIAYPVLSVVVSGGHTEFVYFEKIGSYKILGSTIDDAAGECLDKIGRMLGLGYPAAPVVERFAKLGNQHAVEFPLPMTTTKTYDMSFSGMKTFARNYLSKQGVSEGGVEGSGLKVAQAIDKANGASEGDVNEAKKGETTPEIKTLSKQEIYDFCASAQYGVFRHILYKLNKLLSEVPVGEIWLGGGVAQNTNLRRTLRAIAKERGILFRAPYSKRLCMDNAAMIGVVASYKLERGEVVGFDEIGSADGEGGKVDKKMSDGEAGASKKTAVQKLDRKPRWEVTG